jgi:hypothetical protein
MKNNVWVGYAILVIITTAASVGGIYIVRNLESKIASTNNPSGIVTTTPVVLPSQYPDFDSLSKLHKLVLANNFESWTPSAKLDNKKLITEIIIEKGSLAKAYLFIGASVSSSPLTQWESVYVKMNNKGGHIFRPLSLAVPASTSTQLLFALNQVPYLTSAPYSELKKPLFTDWFALFKDKSEINITSFISSLRPAKIDELILYYQCLDEDSCNIVTSTQKK